MRGIYVENLTYGWRRPDPLAVEVTYMRYGNGAAGISGSATFKPGVNYGSFRPSYNEFDVLNSFINFLTQKPTNNCVIDVSPSGTSGTC